jgi:hypothetical protein
MGFDRILHGLAMAPTPQIAIISTAQQVSIGEDGHRPNRSMGRFDAALEARTILQGPVLNRAIATATEQGSIGVCQQACDTALMGMCLPDTLAISPDPKRSIFSTADKIA